MNKKQKKKAMFSSLSMKYSNKQVFALSDELLKVQAKTKLIAELLKKLKIDKEKVLFVLPKMEKNNLSLAVRNLNNVSLIDARSLNAFAVLDKQKTFFLESSLPVMQKHFLHAN